MIKTRLGTSDADVAVPQQSATEKRLDKDCLFLETWVNQKTMHQTKQNGCIITVSQYQRSTTISKLKFCYQDPTVFRPDPIIVRKLPSEHKQANRTVRFA